MQKKIGILTHPLKFNHGGLMQAYALQEFLHSMGEKSVIVNFDTMEEVPFLRKFLSTFKTFILRNIYRKNVNYSYFSTKTENDIIAMRTNDFKYKFFRSVSSEINSLQHFDYFINKECFTAFIVGSDQVWRPRQFSHFPIYFLSFLQKKTTIKRISYAASFGDSKLNLSENNIQIISEKLPLFDAVSVREDDAVKICQDFGVNAEHVLDPTMLFDASHYLNMIVDFEDNIKRKPIFSYVLDESDETIHKIKLIGSSLKKESHELTDIKIKTTNMLGFSHYVYQKNEARSWLKSIYEADYVVTDSFHGCVFAIIFNKPFSVIINKTRGDSRFYSLLRMFNLEGRVNVDNYNKNINWDSVNKILEEERKKSSIFLKSVLKY